MYAAAISSLDGRAPLLKPDVRADFTKPHSSGTDLVTRERDHFLLGFEAQARRYPFLGPDAFGHSGAVGAAENHRLAAAVIRAATRWPEPRPARHGRADDHGGFQAGLTRVDSRSTRLPGTLSTPGGRGCPPMGRRA